MADWLDAIALGLSAYGTYKASKAATKSANIQADVARGAGEISERQFAQTREDLAPWRAIGEDALYRQAAALGVIPSSADMGEIFRESPGYEFALGEGQKAIERTAAQRGMLESGETLKAITEYGQNVADQRYQQFINNLGIMSGTGQQTTVQTGQLGAGSAADRMAALTAGGRARASGYTGRSEALSSGLSDINRFLGYI